MIVTAWPTAAATGFNAAIVNGSANVTPLLGTPAAVTTTGPVVAPAGALTPMLVLLQLVIVVATVPLNVTVFVPWVAPKFVPVMVTACPTEPDVGVSDVIAGVASNGKGDTVTRHALPGDHDEPGSSPGRYGDGDADRTPARGCRRDATNGHGARALSRAKVDPGNRDGLAHTGGRGIHG